MSLPVLDPRFFTANKPSANFFQKWKNQGSWNEAILPIYEWDGLVYIALDAAFYVAHDPETLHAQFLFPHVLLFAPSQDLKNIWSSYHEQEPEIAAHSPVAPVPTSGGEQVFDMDTLAGQTGLHPTTPETTNEMASSEPDLVSHDIPEGLQLNPSPASPEPKPEPTPEPLPEEKNEQKSSPDWFESFFDKLNSHFPYSMIFLVNENQALPWKWSATLQNDHPTTIDLSLPSPFYVVYQTQQSFHGPVAESSEMSRFCQEWHLPNYPHQLTASPIKINDRLVGILLVIGESEHYQNQLLQLCESCAIDMAKLIQQQPQILKAA